jgi:hypothetical protein
MGGLRGEEEAQFGGADLGPGTDPVAGEEGETGADVALVGRAGERRQASLDPAVMQEIVELVDQGGLLRARRGPLSAKI